jgi:hypothetical protein
MAAETPQPRFRNCGARWIPKILRYMWHKGNSRGEELQRTARPGALIKYRIYKRLPKVVTFRQPSLEIIMLIVCCFFLYQMQHTSLSTRSSVDNYRRA